MENAVHDEVRTVPRLRLAVAATLSGLLAACGTTVHGTQAAAGDGLSSQPPGAVSSTAPGSTDLPLTTTPGLTSSVSSGGSSTGEAVQDPGATATGSDPGPLSAGPATTRALGSVEIGFEVADPATTGAFLKAVGVSGTVVDQKVYVEAIVKDINRRGGLGGHQVKPVYYVLNPTRTDPYDQLMAEMCALWTQDHHVVAAFVNANLDWSPLAHCLDKKHAVFSMFGAWVRDRSDYARAQTWFDPDMLASQDLGPAYVDLSAKLDYFSPKAKVGLLIYDYPQSKLLADIVEHQLQARHITVASTETIHMGTSTPDLSNTIREAQAAVLKFRADGVDHVMSVAYPGAALFFMEQADAQKYYPRYALTSYEGLVATAANAPAKQMANAVGVGFLSDADVNLAQRPAYNASAKGCERLFTSGGMDKTSARVGFIFCDFKNMIQAGALAAGADQKAGWLARGLAASATRYQSAVSFSSLLSSAKHDGAAGAQGMRFDGACSCWKYAGTIDTFGS